MAPSLSDLFYTMRLGLFVSRLCFACHTDAIYIYLNFEQEVHFPKSYFITPLGCVCLLNLSAPDCVCVRVSKSVVLFVFFKLNVVLNVVNRESCLTHFLSAKCLGNLRNFWERIA